MSLVDVKPSDAVEGDADDAVEGAGEVADEAAGGGGSFDPKDMLLSTSPDLAARDVQARTGLELWSAHLVIMVRKMIAAVAPSADDDSGMPAIGNGLLAAYHRFLGSDAGDASSDDDSGGDDVGESEASFRSGDDVALEERPDYHDPAAGGAPA